MSGLSPPPITRPPLRSRPRTDPALTFLKLGDVLSEHCGILTQMKRLHFFERGLDETYGYSVDIEGFTILGSKSVRHQRETKEPEKWREYAQGRNGHRVAYDRTRAFVRAAGEALERYACTTYDPGLFVTGSYDTLREHALDPRDCQLPTEREYPFLKPHGPFDPQAPMRWQWGWSLRDDRPILVPAYMAYLSYNAIAGEVTQHSGTSTGWAIHHTHEEAIHTGLRETIERDSFFLMWLNKMRAPRLDLDTVKDPACVRFRDQIRAIGADLRVYVTTTDVGIPSFAAMVVDRRPNHPAFLLTLGAHPDPIRGLRQALEEASMVHVHVTAQVRAGVKPVEKEQDIRKMSDHGEFYLLQKNLGPLEWMLHDEQTIGIHDVPQLGSKTDDVWEEVQMMVRHLAAAGMDTIFLDTTPPDLHEAGWAAAKVLVPGSVRHEYGYGMRMLNCRRIFEAPVRMGQRAAPPRVEELNPTAHPYA